MKITLINANTTVALTERMLDAAQRLLLQSAEIEGKTAAFGHSYISTPEAFAIAEEAVLQRIDEIADHPEQPDAVLIACFGDPGLYEARRRLHCPVIGMADASCYAACQLGERFSIITGGTAWGPMLDAFINRIGQASRLASIRALELTGAEISADPQGSSGLIRQHVNAAIKYDRADVVILGGAGLIGIADMIQHDFAQPVIDSLEASISQALALSMTRHRGLTA